MTRGTIHRRTEVPLPLALLATIVTLGIAAGLELAVYGRSGHDALGDLPGRFFAWHLHPAVLPFGGRPIEYPVVVGYVVWVTSWFGRTAGSFVVANGVVSAGLALLLTVVLHHRSGRRIWRWVAGVPLALYAFHNWDLVAMVPAIIGLDAFEDGHDATCGTLLAVGASAKVFPGLFLPPLALLRWRAGDRRGARRLVGAFVTTIAVLNGPAILRSWSSWSYPASFQGARSATWGSLWFWLLRVPGVHAIAEGHLKPAADALAIVVLVGGLVLISWRVARVSLSAIEIGAAVVGVFLLANKIYSPNYDLWIVPFFALLPIAKRVWVTFCTADLAIFVLVYGHFHGQWSSATVETLLPALVAVRALVILAVVVIALRLNRLPTPRRTVGAGGSRAAGASHSRGAGDLVLGRGRG